MSGFLDRHFSHFAPWLQNAMGLLFTLVLIVMIIHATMAPTFVECRLMIQESKDAKHSFARHYTILPDDGDGIIANEYGKVIIPVRGFWPRSLKFKVLDPKSKGGKAQILGEFSLLEPIPVVSAISVSKPEIVIHTYRDTDKIELLTHRKFELRPTEPLTVMQARLLQNQDIPILTVVHLEGLGDIACNDNGWCGTKGEGRRLEGFTLSQRIPHPGLALTYRGHVEGSGDTPWVSEGQLCGTRGQSKRLEGIEVRLQGPESEVYSVYYSVHISRIGDSEVMRDGQFAGTKGQARSLEALRVWVRRK